jgi:hypothetical protein
VTAPVRQPRSDERAEAPLDPAVLRFIEALAEAQARKDYDARFSGQDAAE